jgi:CelD/BcsL family acetyltransferase involved in cellulose biosynthesis
MRVGDESVHRTVGFQKPQVYPVAAMGLHGQLVVDPERLERFRADWDRLAEICRRPYCAPAWMLAWWRHAAPEGALLRAAVALEDGRLVGIAPFWAAQRRLGSARLMMLAGGTASRLEPLAEPGREREAAEAFAIALASADPRPGLVVQEEVPADSPWSELLVSAWPERRRPTLARSHRQPAPVLRLEYESFDSWLATKSGNFRQQLRRSRRKLEAAGGRFRVSSEDQLPSDLDAFARLHHGRWEERGGSGALHAGVERMLAQAGRELAPLDRFRLWCLDVDGRTVSAQLLVAAGGELAYWLGGFDESFAAQRPGLVTLAVAIDDALVRGEERLDLGPGGQDYKYRLADGEEVLEHVTIVPPGPLAPLVRGELAARRAARVLLRR